MPENDRELTGKVAVDLARAIREQTKAIQRLEKSMNQIGVLLNDIKFQLQHR